MLDELGLDKDDTTLIVFAEIIADGEVVTGDNRIVSVREPYYDYGLKWLFNDDPEEASGSDVEVFLNEPRYIEKDREAREYSSKSPDGETFIPYTIIDITSSDPEVISREEDSDGFNIEGKRPGTSIVTIRYKDIYGVEQEPFVFNISVVESKYSVRFENEYSDSMVVLKAVPGGSVELKAAGERYVYNDPVSHYDGFSLRWSFTDDIFNDYASIEPSEDSKSAVVKVNADVDPDDEVIADGIGVKVEIVPDGEENARGVEEARVKVKSEYYELANLPEEEAYMYLMKGKTFTFEPELRRYATDTVNEPGGYEIVTGKEMTISFDEEVLSVTSNGQELEYGDSFEGSFTVTRNSDAEDTLELEVWDDESDDEPLVSKELDFYEMFNLSKAKTSRIKDYVYKGKTLKPALGDVYVINAYDTQRWLWEDEHFTISYGKNKYVGPATVTLKGINNCYGTKTITFNILPAATKLSKLKAGRKSFTVTWKKQATQTTGYEIQYGLKKNFKGAKTLQVKKNKTTKATIKKLKGGKTYYVRIRTYKKIGKKYYRSAWSSAKKIKVKR